MVVAALRFSHIASKSGPTNLDFNQLKTSRRTESILQVRH